MNPMSKQINEEKGMQSIFKGHSTAKIHHENHHHAKEDLESRSDSSESS